MHLAGKFTETLNKFHNLVIIHDHNNPYNLIENMNIFCSEQKLTQLCSIVHILINNFDDTINFLEFQKQARDAAKTLKSANMLVYIIIKEKVSFLAFIYISNLKFYYDLYKSYTYTQLLKT